MASTNGKERLIFVEQVLGKTFRNYLTEEIIVIDDHSISRDELVHVYGVGNLMAARRLGQELKDMNIRTTQALYQMDPLSLVRHNGLGERSIFVAMCLLERKGKSPVKWWEKNFTTKFSTAKSHAMEETKALLRAKRKQREEKAKVVWPVPKEATKKEATR